MVGSTYSSYSFCAQCHLALCSSDDNCQIIVLLCVPAYAVGNFRPTAASVNTNGGPNAPMRVVGSLTVELVNDRPVNRHIRAPWPPSTNVRVLFVTNTLPEHRLLLRGARARYRTCRRCRTLIQSKKLDSTKQSQHWVFSPCSSPSSTAIKW